MALVKYNGFLRGNIHGKNVAVKRRQAVGKSEQINVKRPFKNWGRLLGMAVAVVAQMLVISEARSGVLNGDESFARSAGRDVQVTLALSERVPFRVFTLAGPSRVVLDLKGITAGNIDAERFAVAGLADARFGLFAPGWTRLVLDLSKPVAVTSVAYGQQSARLVLTLGPADAAAFAQSAGAPLGVDALVSRLPPPVRGDGPLRIAMDAGHGGVDPGATREGIAEKDVVLDFAREFAELAEKDGQYSVFLTRDNDEFVSLEARVERARHAGADLFVSVHANTVERGRATGATVHTLSDRATDRNTAAFAARENGADAAAGLDTVAELDEVHALVNGMAAVETNARSRDFADRLVSHLSPAIGVLAKDPHRSARFSVLMAHDVPSVLLELGFLSNPVDRDNMLNPYWRKLAAKALLEAISEWAEQDGNRKAKLYR